jgi:integrase
VYARGSEVDGLCLQHVIRGDDARSFSGVPQLLFSTTKAGRPQSVSVDDRFVEAILEVAVSLARQREPTNSRARLFDFGPGGYLVRFARVQRSVGYLKALFVRHSNRHGGATGDFSTKLRTVLEISTRLRHSNVKTTQAYLQDAQAHLLLQELPLRVEELLAERGGVDGLRVMIAALLDVKWRM